MSDNPEVFDFVDQFLRDRAAGRELPLSDYLTRFKGHEAAIAGEWLDIVRGSGRSSELERGPASAQRRVGPYRLVRELGRGGQGSVWLAEDVRIARQVALKLLATGFQALSAERRQRFRREAEVVARLAHPALAAIHEADIDGESPYIAMRFVEGESLAARIERAKGGEVSGPLPLRPERALERARLLGFFERAARALHAAHEAGVVHRDVKPANLMVDPRGEPIVLDFGLARDESPEVQGLTHSGDVFGTPAFMSPEQIMGSQSVLDRRTDVWSLGACLYEALTLERPFKGPNVPELMRVIRDEPLVDARAKNPSIPADLAVVVATALEKDPARRYANALELAEDLRRVREYEPILARPAGPLVRLWSWARRHRALAASLASVILLLAGGLTWTAYLLARVERAHQFEEQALQFAVGRHLAQRALDLIGEDPAAAVALGIEAMERAPNYQTRTALLQSLDACLLERAVECHPARLVLDLEPSPDGSMALVALDSGTARVIACADGRTLFETPAHPGEVRRARWLSDGRRFVTLSTDATLRAFDLRDPARASELVLDAPLTGLEASWDRLAVVSSTGTIAILDQADPRTPLLRWKEDARVERLYLSASGRRLVVVLALTDDRSAARVYDVRTGQAIASVDDAGKVRSLTIDRRDERLMLASSTGRVVLCALTDGVPGLAHDFAEPLACARLAPDGRTLALGFDDGAGSHVKLVDARTFEARELVGHGNGRIADLAFDPEGTRVASASHDMTVRIWRVSDGEQLAVCRGILQPVALQWTQDGQRILARYNASTICVWYGSSRHDLYTLRGHRDELTWAGFSRDGALALTTSLDGDARLWVTSPAAARRAWEASTLVLEGGGSALRGGGFSSDGRLVWSWGDDPVVRLSSTVDGREVIELACSTSVASAELAPDGGRLLAVDRAGRAFLWSCPEGRLLADFDRSEDVRCARFSEDGATLYTAHARSAVRAWRASDGRAEFERRFTPAIATHPAAGLIAVHVGRGIMAVGCEDLRVRFFSTTREGETRAPLLFFRQQSLGFDAGGTRLLATGPQGRGAMRLYDLERDTSVQPEVYHAADLTGGSFSHDGRYCLTSSEDGTVFVRDARDGSPFVHLLGHRAGIVHAAFSSDSGPLRVITASRDGTARVTPIDPLPSARETRPRTLAGWEVARESRLAQPLRYP